MSNNKIIQKRRIHVFGPTYIDYSINLKDTISLDGSSRIEQERIFPGGTGLCYAIALSRLHNSVVLHTVVGSDNKSRIVDKFISAEKNINTEIQKVNTKTDYAYILIDKGNHKAVASRKEASNLFNVNLVNFDSLDEADSIVITSLRNDIANSILQNIKDSVKSKPFIMWAPHLPNCKNSKLIADNISLIDHISLSLEEYELLKSQIGDPIKLGVKSITVTARDKGCDLISDSGIKHFESVMPLKKPLDSNGAGEAFGAGFLTSYLITSNYHFSVKTGSYLAYLHIQRSGSDFPKLDIKKTFNLSYSNTL